MTFVGSLTTGYMTNPLIPTKYSPAAGAVALGLFAWMTVSTDDWLARVIDGSCLLTMR